MSSPTGRTESTPQHDEFVATLRQARVLPDATLVRRRMVEVQGANLDRSADEQVRLYLEGVKWRCTAMGAALALPMTIPTPFLAVQAALFGAGLAAETWAVFRVFARAHRVTAGLLGLDIHAPERETELAEIWSRQVSAWTRGAEAAGASNGMAVATRFLRERLPELSVTSAPRQLASAFSRRSVGGVSRMGRVMPFGVGAAVGGGVNYLAARSFADAIIDYYTERGIMSA